MNLPAHRLAATCRCLTDDLGFAPHHCEQPLRELAERNGVVADFIDRRSQSPTGQETVRSLAPSLIAFSLHSGRFRGATWFHEALGVVWLLAARLHREGSGDDAYPHFESLHRRGQLLPTREDIARVLRARATSFAQSLLEVAPTLRAAARQQPDVTQEGLLGGRVRVRLVHESGDPPLLTVAISSRLEPGEVQVPPEWHVQVLAAFFPETRLDELSYTDVLAGEPLREDESAYCDFAHPSD